MKKLLLLFAVVVLLGVSCSRVPPGYTGIKVNLLGSEKGDMEELSTGRYYIGINEELHLFPTFNQNYIWTASKDEGSPNDESITFSVEGLVVRINVGIEYNLNPGQISDIFIQYRKGVDELTDITIRNVVRDSFNAMATEYDMDTLIAGGMDELVGKVENSVRETFAPSGINILSITLVTAPIYPDTVVNAIEAKINATQQAIARENQLRETEAEAKKQIAEAEGYAQSQLIRARADSEADALRSRTYTDAVLQAMWIDKWDGKLPTTLPGDSDLMMGIK
jgi:regulator of protease activity HflC (stomatin/prohibitin superfamily)